MAGRPREFDREAALDRAMETFWARGYEATSVQDLLDAMGINRASMYATFGDKRALFSAAVDRYGDTVFRCLEDTLGGPGSPLANVRRAVRDMRDQAVKATAGCKGCMITHTAVELAPHDAATARAVRGLLRRMERAFRQALGRAVDARELPRRTDTRALARFLTGTVQGLVVLGKAAPGPVLDDVVEVALSAVR